MRRCDYNNDDVTPSNLKICSTQNLVVEWNLQAHEHARQRKKDPHITKMAVSLWLDGSSAVSE